MKKEFQSSTVFGVKKLSVKPNGDDLFLPYSDDVHIQICMEFKANINAPDEDL